MDYVSRILNCIENKSYLKKEMGKSYLKMNSEITQESDEYY